MSATFDLSGKKAIVTGGAGDIGFAIAKELYLHGAVVTLLDLDPNIQNKVDELKALGEHAAFGVKGNLSDRDNLKASFNESVELMGGLDILVNCAGIIRRAPAVEFSEKDWDDVIEVNLTALFLLSQMAGRIMLEQKFGRIINIASMNSFTGGMIVPSYAASKGAVSILTKSLSNEWAGQGVTVNAIAPGYIQTRINPFYFTPAGKAQYEVITNRIPAGRWGKADDLAGAAVFLASDAAEYVSGVTLPVDGGFMGR